MKPDSVQERRLHQRLEVAIIASVFRQDSFLGSYVIEDICAGGARMIGQSPIKKGEEVYVILHLKDYPQLRIRAQGVHCRALSTDRNTMGVEFHHDSNETEDIIQEMVISELERVHISSAVLVVDDCKNTCRAIERDLRALGRSCVLATTPLETVRWLVDPKVHVDTALIDLILGSANGLDLLDYVATDFPKIHRVLISGKVRAFQLELALISRRAHAVLSKPWDRKRLAEAIDPH